MNAPEPVTTTSRNRERQTHNTPVKSNNEGLFYLMFFVVSFLLVCWGKWYSEQLQTGWSYYEQKYIFANVDLSVKNEDKFRQVLRNH